MQPENKQQILRHFPNTPHAPVEDQATTPLATMHRVYAGAMDGNFEVFLDELAADAELSICGFPPMSGTWRGPDTIIEAIRGNFALVESQHTALEGMISDADRVAVLLRESGTLRATGEAYTVRFVQWFTFHAGKIARIEQICAAE